MFKIQFLVVFIISIMITSLFGQATKVINLDTVSNSTSKNGNFLYLEGLSKEFNYSHIDSISIGIYAQGEVDLDTLEFYPGFLGTYRSNITAISQMALDTIGFTVNINLDSAETAYTYIGTIPKSFIKDYNMLYYYTAGAASGCDATDPGQKVWLVARIWGTRKDI